MEALASAAVRAAHKVDAKLIIAFTVTGRTARLLAK
jgi:pyruvate kinase